jgi:hypothetical protein
VILLDSDQILAAISRSLMTHVLPALDDEYARVQVQAALTALDEVRHRLVHGDPYEAVNERLRAQLGAFADELRDASPDTAARVDTALVALDQAEDPRSQHRRMAEALTLLLADDEPALHGLRTVLEQQTIQTASADAIWICGPAIESLQ